MSEDLRQGHGPRAPSTFSSTAISLSLHQATPLQQSVSCRLDKEDGTPIIAPLDTLEQVLSWEPCCEGICVPSIGLRSRTDHNGGSKMDDPSAQKTIVCHDMMGGYIKDKFIQGHKDLSDYYFYQWQYIDAFIYFSHHFISLPPPNWTNVAHKNGVLSMGTIITEWEQGAKICHSLLSDEWKVMQFCDQLVGMAKYYRFDGWLVNIENPIHPTLMDKLYMLLSLLTTGMHSACPGSKVIWYDSITVQGQLKWQNQINHLNKPFFDLCDGIFLNYNWSESGLSSSHSLAGERCGEVYVGVDVFGRGCYGGGGFNTYKAVEVISRQQLSISLFAPGWVYETQDKSHFFKHQERFWSLLTPWIPSTSISTLPLVSSFGRGYGESMSIDGKVVCSGPWTNHSAQDIQPAVPTLSAMITSGAQSTAIRIDSVVFDTTTAYNNGASLRFEGSMNTNQGPSKPALAKLFKTNIAVNSPLLVAFTYKDSSSHLSMKVYLTLHTSGTPSRVFLDTSMSAPHSDDVTSAVGFPRSSHVSNLPGCVLAPLSFTHSKSLQKIFAGITEPTETWSTKYFIIDPDDVKGALIQEITLGFYLGGGRPKTNDGSARQTFSLSLGEIKVLYTESLSLDYEVLNIWSHSYIFSKDQSSVSLTLSWMTSDSDIDTIEHCNIYSSVALSSTSEPDVPWKTEYMYRGRAYANSFRLTNLFLLKVDPEHCTSFSFVVQPVTVSRRKSSLNESPRLTVEFKV